MNINPDPNLAKSDNDTPSPMKVSFPLEMLWAAIGLLLTILSTFVEAFITNPPWEWVNKGIYSHSLGITYQIGAVLLTGCLGGKNAGALSQVAYILLGLAWLPIFGHGGGWNYWQEPSFGFILGFVPGAWLCGFLAFQDKAKIEGLAFSSLAGLGVIHGIGIGYLIFLTLAKIPSPPILTWENLPTAIFNFSLVALPGQIILVCLSAVLAFFIRKLLFY